MTLAIQPETAVTRMTEKGQVTIPKAARLAAGLRPGAMVHVHTRPNGEVVLRAQTASEVEAAAITRFHAVLDEIAANPPLEMDMSTDEYLALIREPLEPFERDPEFRPSF